MDLSKGIYIASFGALWHRLLCHSLQGSSFMGAGGEEQESVMKSRKAGLEKLNSNNKN